MKEIIDFLIQEEGVRLNAYPDPATKNDPIKQGEPWTIGVGNTYYEDGTKVKKGDKITKERVLKLAEFVAGAIVQHVKRCLKKEPTPGELVALVSMCYNCGNTRFANSVVVKMINAGQSKAEIREVWKRSFVTANGVKNNVLIGRRLREATLYFNS